MVHSLSVMMIHILSFSTGVIIGAVIWYTADTKEQTPKVHTDTMVCGDEVDPPDSIYLELQYPNQSVYFVYDREEVIKNLTLNESRTINTFGDRVRLKEYLLCLFHLQESSYCRLQKV